MNKIKKICKTIILKILPYSLVVYVLSIAASPELIQQLANWIVDVMYSLYEWIPYKEYQEYAVLSHLLLIMLSIAYNLDEKFEEEQSEGKQNEDRKRT